MFVCLQIIESEDDRSKSERKLQEQVGHRSGRILALKTSVMDEPFWVIQKRGCRSRQAA